jgi:DNA invertase Pin-like site-specific DNA recombinase
MPNVSHQPSVAFYIASDGSLSASTEQLRQKIVCETFANRYGYTVTSIYTDASYIPAAQGRRGFKQLCTDARSQRHPIDCVLVESRQRIGQFPHMMQRSLQALEATGVCVRIVDEVAPDLSLLPLKVAFYARASTAEAIDTQFSICQTFFESVSARVPVSIRWYADHDGIDGDGLNRPGLQRLLRAIQEGEVDTLLIDRLERFARDQQQYQQLAPILEHYVVPMVAVTV